MCHLHGGFLLTKVTKQVRARGGGAEATPEKDATGSPESSPASSGKVQYGLSKFFGSASQKKEAQPVPLHLQLQPYKRQRLGRFQEDAIREKNEALRQQAEFEASQATNEPELIEAAQKRQRLMAREPSKSPKASPQSTNRKRPGSCTKRAEISAATKLKYCQEMKAVKDTFSSLQDFWAAQVEKYGIRKDALKNILSKEGHWEKLVAEKDLKSKNKHQFSKRKRASGAGRKVPFPDIISKMKQWLSIERACGHTIAKQDLLAEYLGRLQLTANELRNNAQVPEIPALKRAELLADAKEREVRKEKLCNSDPYRRKTKAQLVKWLDAKYMSTELVTNISQVEAQTRTKLTWQEFDHTLWLATCASQQTLADSNRLSSPDQFISARSQLVIGFSDQVPLWAKATGRRAVFAEEELHASADVKDYSSVRLAMSEAMHSEHGPDMVIGPIVPSTPQVQRKFSFESSPKESVVRQLSFTSAASSPPASQPEQDSLVKQGSFDSAPPSQSEQCPFGSASPAAGDAEQMVPASPEQDAKASTQKDASSTQPSAPAAKPALPQPGSTTLIGISGEDRYRITYEARQLLHSVYGDESQEIIGSVGKGLLVVPGEWARLSNISESGTWLSDETFKIGDKVITRTQGSSAGRVMLPYRRLRQNHPELMSKVDIMQQPAANVDSVILSWSIQAQAAQYPASIWMRDCFSSMFSDSATESMALANQLSCLVAEKCTSKLQITDTDFAKPFKALVRHKLIDLRAQWQTQRKVEHSVWKVGPLEIVTAVVAAQEAMADKNLKDEWVLRAAVRNGILVYRPDPASGRLVELLSQSWAKEMGLEVGTKRYSPEWLRDRLKWRDGEGVPAKADWNLSSTAKQISDLQIWDYYHPEDEKDCTEEDLQPEITDAIAEDLELELQNSLSLRIHPSLRRAQIRRMGTAEYQSKKDKAVVKRARQRKLRKLLRKHKSKLVQKVAEKLSGMSRDEALAELQPEARQKSKPKKKLSLAFKPSIKNKASCKTKPSAKLKSLKKKTEKQALAKALVKAGSKQDLSEKPPLPPPEQAPPAEIEFDDPLFNQEVVIVSEAAGRLSFGKHGKLTHGSTPATYICVTDSGAYQVEPEWVEIKSSKAKVLKVKWPKWTQLSKRDLSLMLSQLSCNPEDEVGLSPKEWSIHTVIPCPKEIPEMEDQHLWLGWALLRWCFDKANVALPDVLGVHCVDPILSKLILKNDGNPEQLEGFKEGIKISWSQHCKLLLVPVYSQFHWTLLAAQRAGPGKPITWRRYDSLSKEHEESHPQQIFMGQLLDPDFTLPPLSNIATQPVGSNACGCYVLHYIEEELRVFRGEWPSVWPGGGWKDWKLRLVTIVPKLLAHANALIEDAKVRHAKLESQMAGIAQQKTRLRKS